MQNSGNLINILKLTALEKHALLSSMDGRRKIFVSYLAMREKVSEDFLPLINSSEPFINDHSHRHLERVLEHIEDLLINNFPKPNSQIQDINIEKKLTWSDTLILLNALVWHDIGNIYGRKEHGKKIRKCYDIVANELYDEHLKGFILQVAEAHSGLRAIDDIIPDSHASASYGGQEIHLQYLASILRFADELDEDYRRSEPHNWERLEILPNQNKRFWYFCKINSSIKVKTTMEIHDLSLWVEIESHIPKSEFTTKFYVGRKKIEALAEYFRRLIKIESERRYCNEYMRTAYYHPGIRGINVSLNTHERDESPVSGEVFKLSLTDHNSIQEYIKELSMKKLHKFIQNAIEWSK